MKTRSKPQWASSVDGNAKLSIMLRQAAIIPVLLATLALIACSSNDSDAERQTNGEEATPFQDGSAPAEIESDGQSDSYVQNYQISYAQCQIQADQLYAEAGTSDPVTAAEYLADTFRRDTEAWHASFDGCFDALVGSSSEYPE